MGSLRATEQYFNNTDLEITWVRLITLSLECTQRRATPLLPPWIYSCRPGGTVSCALLFTTNVTISASISQTIRSLVTIFNLRQPMTFLSHSSYGMRGLSTILTCQRFCQQSQSCFRILKKSPGVARWLRMHSRMARFALDQSRCCKYPSSCLKSGQCDVGNINRTHEGLKTSCVEFDVLEVPREWLCCVTLQFVIITQFVIHYKLRWIATQFVIHRISNCVVTATRFVMYYKLRQNFIILKYWKGEKIDQLQNASLQ